jgi:hypothetical protein
MVEFDPQPVKQKFYVRFAGSQGCNFSHNVTLPSARPGAQGTQKYLFAVYEKEATADNPAWSRFIGIEASPGCAAAFHGLNRLTSAETFHLWPEYCIPAEARNFVWWQRLPKLRLVAELWGLSGYHLAPTPRIAIRAACNVLPMLIGYIIQYLAAGAGLLLLYYALIRLTKSGRLQRLWKRIRG